MGEFVYLGVVNYKNCGCENEGENCLAQEKFIREINILGKYSRKVWVECSEGSHWGMLELTLLYTETEKPKNRKPNRKTEG